MSYSKTDWSVIDADWKLDLSNLDWINLSDPFELNSVKMRKKIKVKYEKRSVNK